jgi:hypothetical protein
MVTVQTIINPLNIIFNEECEQNFEWDLYQNNDLSIKLRRKVGQKFIVIKEKKQPQELEHGELNQRSRLLFERAMALLRVYKRGNVQANSFQIIIDDVPLETQGFPYMNSWGPTLFSFYILNVSDKDRLKDIFNYFEILDIENTSLHWFTYAPFRPIIRDRLVDYVIAMESMFVEYSLTPVVKSGKEKTLTSRGRDIFNSLDYGSDTRPSVSDWDAFVHEFYDYRSRIVHGAKKEDQPPEEDLIKVVDNLEIICRGFLKRFLKDGVLFDWNLRKRTYNWPV